MRSLAVYRLAIWRASSRTEERPKAIVQDALFDRVSLCTYNVFPVSCRLPIGPLQSILYRHSPSRVFLGDIRFFTSSAHGKCIFQQASRDGTLATAELWKKHGFFMWTSLRTSIRSIILNVRNVAGAAVRVSPKTETLILFTPRINAAPLSSTSQSPRLLSRGVNSDQLSRRLLQFDESACAPFPDSSASPSIVCKLEPRCSRWILPPRSTRPTPRTRCVNATTSQLLCLSPASPHGRRVPIRGICGEKNR